jgi:two-component system phosphate regulon sensor histidine kinase PhoR
LKTLATVAVLLLLAGLLGTWTGHPALCVAVAALLVLTWHYWRLRQVLLRLSARQRWETSTGTSWTGCCTATSRRCACASGA